MPTPLEQWYLQIPIFTRIYTTAVFALTLGLQLGWISSFQLFYNYEYTFHKGQYWRPVTTFLFSGYFSLEWLLNMYFVVQYCRDLEEGSYLNRPADFAWLVLLICTTLLIISPMLDLPFLGDPLISSLTYIWSRQYSYIFINFLGLFTTSASYLPWVMAGFTSVVGNRWPVSDLVGIGVGHVFWFLGDEWPRRSESGGYQMLKAPRALCKLFNQDVEDPNDGLEVDQDTAGEAPAVQQQQPAGLEDAPTGPPAYVEDEKANTFSSLASSWDSVEQPSGGAADAPTGTAGSTSTVDISVDSKPGSSSAAKPAADGQPQALRQRTPHFEAENADPAF
ncbi:DER1-domain-containing protein [Martensiomyces pterosporus]|nr:DER1-domain-containing protein [Martensiomyces pterosporus]